MAERYCGKGPDGYLALSERVREGYALVESDSELERYFASTAPLSALRLVAIDAEWSPSDSQSGRKGKGGKGKGGPAATVAQLGLLDAKGRGHFLVVDLLKVTPSAVATFLVEGLFKSRHVVKVGYGLGPDVRAIERRAAQGGGSGGTIDSHKFSGNHEDWIDLRIFHGELINPR